MQFGPESAETDSVSSDIVTPKVTPAEPIKPGDTSTMGIPSQPRPETVTLSRLGLPTTMLRRLCLDLSADVAQFLLREPAIAPDGTTADVLRIVQSVGIERPPDHFRVPVGQGFAGQIADRALPACLDDTSDLETFGSSWHDAGINCLAGVPLVIGGRVIGVAQIARRRIEPFTAADILALESVADRAAWAVENGLLHDAERAARHDAQAWSEQMQRLRDMSHELLSDLTVQGVVTAVVERGLSLLGAMAGAVWEQTGDDLTLRGALGYPEEVNNWWRIFAPDRLSPIVDAGSQQRTIVFNSPAERDVAYPHLASGVTVGVAFVAAPLIVHGRTIGVLGLSFDTAEQLDEHGLAFLDAAVAQCASALHRALIYETRQRELHMTQKNARRLASLQRVTAGLADAQTDEEVARIVVDESDNLTHVLFCTLTVPTEDRKSLRLLASYGLSDEMNHDFVEFSVDAHLPAAVAFRTGRPVVIPDAVESRRLFPRVADAFPDDSTFVCTPLQVGGRMLGTIGWCTSNQLEDGAVAFMSALADQCAHAFERTRLLRADQQNRLRLETLAEVGRILADPIGIEETAQRFCALLAGRFGEAASIHLSEPPSGFGLLGVATTRPEHEPAYRCFAAGLPQAVVEYLHRVLDRNAPVTLSDNVTAAMIEASDDPAVRQALTDFPVESIVVLPLIVDGRQLGVLVLSVSPESAALDQYGMEHVVEIADRLALALDAARLLQQQTEIAHTLQHSLLPSHFPEIPGGSVAVRYLPGEQGGDVGGDFFDVIPLRGGEIGLVVGDVMGRGVRAAAVMGQVRAAVRGYLLDGHSPIGLLERMDRLVVTLEDDLLVTMLYAVWDPTTHVARCAVAGHLPPLLRRPGEPARYVDCDPGLPLGVGVGSFHEVEVELPPGSLLLGYTDGLVEGPMLPVDEGMQRLAAALPDFADAEAVCDAVLEAMAGMASAGGHVDDTALLAFVTGVSWRDVEPRSAILPAHVTSPAAARRILTDTLTDWGVEHLDDAACLVLSELVTNAVRHAETDIRVTMRRTANGIRLEVTDSAPTRVPVVRDPDDGDEGGRGLVMLDTLASSWGSLVEGTTKTMWCEIEG